MAEANPAITQVDERNIQTLPEERRELDDLQHDVALGQVDSLEAHARRRREG